MRMTLMVGLIASSLASTAFAQGQPRARDLGATFEGETGPLNAITDVPGVLVGQTTVILGEGKHAIRTGVTAIIPRKELGYYPAAVFTLNGDAEMSGAIFAEEFGMLRSPIMLTGTASNGTVFTSVIRWSLKAHAENPVYMPVVADTWDAEMSDAFSFPLTDAHVRAALTDAKSGPVAEGNVGGGTGMVCFYFKGGIGTASRRVTVGSKHYTLGVLVQCNTGKREDLMISGRAVGKAIPELPPTFAKVETGPDADGSIIIVIGTDAPLLPGTLKALGKRAALGLARTGGMASPGSGDIMIAFSTAKIDVDSVTGEVRGKAPVFQYNANPLFRATVQATEEAIINALVAARTMTGLNGATVHGLPPNRLRELLVSPRR